MIARAIVLGCLLALAAASPTLALDQRIGSVRTGIITRGFGPGVWDPWLPPLPPLPPLPKPPSAPSQPVIGVREATSIKIMWWDLGTTETASAVERNTNKNGIWTVVATYGPLSGFVSHTDEGLTPDTLYCYRVRAANDVGSTLSKEQCVYTKDGTDRGVVRAQIRIRTGNSTNAGTDSDVAVLLNSATSVYAIPSGNKTWINYSHDDFERGSDFTYDLSLDRIGEIGDINMISIQKSGGDAWCLAGFDLLVNGAVLFSRSFEAQPGGCQWLTNSTSTSNIVTVSFPELRATPGWATFHPTILPVFPPEEIVSRLESIVGNAIHGSALYWGELQGSEYLEVTKVPDQNALHVDLDLAASVDYAPNPSVDIQFDLMVSGGCTPDRRIALNIEPTNVKISADLSLGQSFAQFFECGITLDNPFGCIENGVAAKVRAAFSAPALTTLVDDAGLCDDGEPHPWVVLQTGLIMLEGLL